MYLEQKHICLICGDSFTLKSKFHPNQKFCNPKCRVASENKKRSIAKKEWTLLNKEKVCESKKKWILQNPEKRKEASAAYQRRNKAYYNQYATLRSRYVKQARPKWLNEFEELWLDEIYDLAQKRQMEVDHIVPIKHDRVCGLHVPWNLQLLTRSQNAAKSNRFDEDVVAILSKKEPLNG